MRRKKSIKRTVSLLLALTMTLSILLTSIGEVNGAQFFTIYFKPTSNWLEADARFAVYQFDSSGNNDWVDMTLCDENENVYSAEVNASAYDNIIFCRMNPGSAEITHNLNNYYPITTHYLYNLSFSAQYCTSNLLSLN